MRSEKSCNRIVLGIVGIACAAFLTGCTDAMPDLTESETQAIGEYAGVVMLKYDAHHRSRLVDLSEYTFEEPMEEVFTETVEEEPEETETPEMGEGALVVDQTEPVEPNMPTVSLEEFLLLPNGMSLTYNGRLLAKDYPEETEPGDYFALHATDGKQFLVLQFTLSNGTGMPQDVNFLDDGITFKCILNGSATKTALVTLLANDMSTYLGEVPADAEESMVLIFEVTDEVAETLESVSLNLKSESDVYTIDLL
jgi:hypothetical protein